MTVFLSNGLFISEFLGDNAGPNAFDTDGDGGANKADEFIEIQSASSATIDLSGFQIWSADRGLLYAFQSGDTIPPRGTATVVGQYDGAEPAGFYDAGLPDSNANAGLLPDGQGANYDTIYLVDTNTGEYIQLSYGDPPQVSPLPAGFPGTNLVGSETITSGLPNGTPIQRDSQGNLIEGTTPTPGVGGPICFARGTLIQTPDGERPVESLNVGDNVTTLDHGPQPVRWLGMHHLSPAELALRPSFRPIRIRAGALGCGTPTADLTLSPQHRVLAASQITRRMFATPEVLVAAKTLLSLPGVEQVSGTDGVDYFHLLLGQHEILLANGAPAESLYLGEMTLGTVGPDALEEIRALFPEIIAKATPPRSARTLPEPKRIRRMMARHVQNRQALLSSFGPKPRKGSESPGITRP